MARVDHTWLGGGVEAHAHLGFSPEPPRCWQVFAETEAALVVTGRLCALSLHHGPGTPIRLGPAWWKAPDDVWRNLHDDD